ncbi:RNA-directed RNA polymerase catalytic subunit [Bienertia sinuspersici]
MGEIVKQILTRPVQLADQITKATDEVVQFKPECLELQAKTKKLADLIRQVARCSNDLYERPTHRIIDDTEQILEKALALVEKCCTCSLIKHVFTIIPNTAFRKMTCQLDNSIGDVSWLLRVSTAKNDDDDANIGYPGLPPIVANEPILCLIWEQVANLSSRMLEERSDAAASLVSLARDNERYGKLIIEEARMKVQAIVAWAVSELAAHYPKCEDHLAQNNVIRLFVSHLAFKTIQEHSRIGGAGASASGAASGTDHEDEKQAANQMKPSGGMPSNMANVVSDTMVRRKSDNNSKGGSGYGNKNVKTQTPTQAQNQNHQHTQHVLAGGSIKGREYENPVIKAEMKAMAARALWHLAKGNVSICRSIIESIALLCFVVLLEKGQEEVKYNSAMALMEITSVAEDNTDIRKTAFKSTSPAAKAVVDQLLRVVTEANPNDLETEVMLEAVIALLKFACSDNYLHDLHYKSIINGGGVKFLIQLPNSEALAQEEVIIILEWATKQSHIMQDTQVDDLLPEAKSRLELYQSRGSRF